MYLILIRGTIIRISLGAVILVTLMFWQGNLLLQDGTLIAIDAWHTFDLKLLRLSEDFTWIFFLNWRNLLLSNIVASSCHYNGSWIFLIGVESMLIVTELRNMVQFIFLRCILPSSPKLMNFDDPSRLDAAIHDRRKRGHCALSIQLLRWSLLLLRDLRLRWILEGKTNHIIQSGLRIKYLVLFEAVIRLLPALQSRWQARRIHRLLLWKLLYVTKLISCKIWH